MRITFTLDMEDHRIDRTSPGRYPRIVRELLVHLRDWGVCGTFFVVGNVARRDPDLVREISAAGHEIGYHGHDHVPLPHSDPVQLYQESRRDKDFLEQLTGREVSGYRAPMFSLIPETAWAVDVIERLGFRYSSSVLPASNPFYGSPEFPRAPFRWSGGLIELPVPVLGPGRLALPYLGGIYFRYVPRILQTIGLRRPGQLKWIYCHPFDFDHEEPFARLREGGRIGSVLLWLNRRRTYDKLAKTLRGNAAPPLGERIDEIVDWADDFALRSAS